MRKLKNEELERLTVQEFKQVQKVPVTLLLDNVRSLNNVGSAFRTGDAFLVEKILLCGITGKPPHREINKTALGATESVEWEYQKDPVVAAEKLRASGHKIVVIEQMDQSISLSEFKPSLENKWCLVFGNEVFGVTDSLVPMADHCVEIPQFGTKHSLNISVSIGIVLWDFLTKMKLS